MSLKVNSAFLRKYTVYTPQTNQTFVLRAMTVGDDLKFKGSLIGEEQITQHIASILYDCIVEFPEGITTFEQYASNITTHDHQALFFGLYHVTYDEIDQFPVKACPSCSKPFEVSIPTESLLHINKYPEDKNILEERVEVSLPISKLTAVIKQPTLQDEIVLYKTLPNFSGIHRDLLKQAIFIEDFKQGKKKTENVHEKLSVFQNLPAKERKIINKAYEEAFGKYSCELYSEIKCPYCSHQFRVDVNFSELFFRMVAE